jgi:hypothetical protein
VSDDTATLLARALERQTEALIDTVEDLRGDLRAAVARLEADGRATRRGLVGVVLAAVLILGGALGVRTVVGAAEAAPAVAPLRGPPTPGEARWVAPVVPVGYAPVVCGHPSVHPLALEAAARWWESIGWYVPVVPLGTPGCVEVLAVPPEEMGPYRGLTLYLEDPGAPPGGPYTWAVVAVRDGADALAIAHELGHVIGIQHTTRCGSVMSPGGGGCDPAWSARGVPRW